MPLTAFQREVASILAANRNPESHLGGGAVINRADNSLRYSDDLDVFHDAADSVAVCAEADAKVLLSAGFTIEWTLQRPGFFRATVRRGEEQGRLDWSCDSAFRYFPVLPDNVFGYCLHRADLAVNKVLALASRIELRDFLDIVYLDESYLSLGAIVWAACGKDPGYTPDLLLDMTNRHVRFQPSDLRGEILAQPLDLKELKQKWLNAYERAESLCQHLPEPDLGCLYLDAENNPITPVPDAPDFASWKRHFGSVRGAWPTIS